MLDAMSEAALESPEFYIAWGGLVIGLVFGFVVQRTNFCTMGSISDILSFGDWRRFRAWILAGVVAVLGVWWLESMGAADMAQTIYVSPSLAWGGHVIGGLMFGFGMVFAGGCASKNLVRAGSGDLRSLVVLIVMGLFAYMTIGGIVGPIRVAVVTPLTADLAAAGLDDQRLGSVLAGLSGLGAETANMVAVLAVALAGLVFVLVDGRFLKSPSAIISGVVIGLCVVAGWFLTGITFDEFADNPQLASLTYTRPVGDTLEYLTRFTAFGAPGFAVVTTFGALAGAFLGALSQRKFHLATFTDTSDTLRNMFGAALMGIGGVVGLGCTVGQAITGVSTLAMGSFLTFACIVIGAIIGMKAMEAMA